MSARPNLPRIILIAVLVIVGFGLGLGTALYFRERTPAPADIPGLLWPNPKPLTPFALVDHDGQPFTLTDLRGRWSLLFFGFTYCPDMCPTTLTVLRDLLKLHADTAGDAPVAPRVVFVSVDPDRDSPPVLKNYVGFFAADFLGVTGPADNIEQLTSQLGIIHFKVPDTSGTGYEINHSSSVLLIDPAARLVGVFSPPLDANDILLRLRQIQQIVERDP